MNATLGEVSIITNDGTLQSFNSFADIICHSLVKTFLYNYTFELKTFGDFTLAIPVGIASGCSDEVCRI